MANPAVDKIQAELKALPRKLLAGLRALAAARTTLAFFLLLSLAFASQLWIAPGRLPPLGGFSLLSLGVALPDFGEAGRIAGEAGAAAQRQGAAGRVSEFFTQHRDQIPAFNGVGLGVSATIFLGLLIHQVRRRLGPLGEGLAKAA
ncbi:MAG: hypothetical protein GC189_10295 [Alphaproteobacteria bacterium]|nr:hypothetical protein [Alphaproteobacteria bacterium]